MGKRDTLTQELDNVIDLTGSTRRRFLQTLGLAGTGLVGFRQAVEKAVGKSLDGVPLVYTRDVHGRPDRVRMIPSERYRRLETFYNLDVRGLIDKHPVINGVSVAQRSDDEEDLAIQLYLDPGKASSRAKARLPNALQRTPVIYEERGVKRHFDGDCDGGDRVGQTVDPLEGNASISVNASDGGAGTLCFVGFNDDGSDPYYQCMLTCWHVVEYRSDKYMWQDGRKVGYYKDGHTGMDVAKYKVTDDATARSTLSSEQPDVTGTWDFSGLTDAVAWGATVGGYVAGRRTCFDYNSCNDTERNARVDYQAEFTERVCTGGDSGAPWVDSDGKLICMHQGWFENWSGKHDRGPVGTELLDAAEARLYAPGP